ncbi:hypothetical protein ER308_04565 [Egibacter rhizosphaerae]|uniref:Plasmid pRiA4b Orf3-like domain-containing protein n=1 Tax=Egibacter rhizosphaerae TaxID=1670831 RepID=A0A411YCF9_9ACTN|nr:hypothetical protein [Egibacter rhizosphaerae]QBI18889.1 hypothetical protein ER308_04565 [Egibacter rhizosphaerae]
MARTWLSIRVELVGGRGEHCWPRPGRVFAAAPTHTFTDLAAAIDTAFGRWDRAHLHTFDLADGALVVDAGTWDDLPQVGEVHDGRALTLDRLALGEQLAYTFDLGDDWEHCCTVEDARIDPTETLGIEPSEPMPFWGWGELPDQYGRRWSADDGESDPPPNPGLADLPPLRPLWGTNWGAS